MSEEQHNRKKRKGAKKSVFASADDYANILDELERRKQASNNVGGSEEEDRENELEGHARKQQLRSKAGSGRGRGRGRQQRAGRGRKS